MWRVARDSARLDVNSPYAYVLWCRDFADTSAVAREGNEVVGFVTGYVRPRSPDTLMIWQVAVDRAHRGRGLAAALLDHVVHRAAGAGARCLETTITADNPASIGLFTALAARWGAGVTRSPIFLPGHFPGRHPGEDLFRIGPLTPRHLPVPR
jgi:diaminobutyrate acetyltransferase